MSHFLLAMMHYPEVLKKAHAELDSVLGPGPGRMPTLADKPKLPYITAIFEEILRWSVPVPLGALFSCEWSDGLNSNTIEIVALPHSLLDDDEYKGMHLPKGSIVRAAI